MDGLLLRYVARELSDTLTGARVDRVLQPEKDELHLVLRGQSKTYKLLLCASASSARAHLTEQAKPNPLEPPMFCMLLRKLLGGGRVREVRQISGDRILEVDFECMDELGERVQRVLICEIMGRHSNIILRDGDGRVLDAIRHVSADMSRLREVRPGLPYTLPPQQGKLDPGEATYSALHAMLENAATRLDRALADGIVGLGAQSAREMAFRLTGREEAHLDAAARRALADPLLKLLNALPELSPPVLLRNEDGEAVDVFPFPQRRFPDSLQQPFHDGPSAAMDALYVLRDRRERMVQKSASLARSLKAHIERCENRLAIHRETLTNEARIEEARINGELLTANLHLIEKNRTLAEVPDYYTGSTRTIPLDPRLSPSHNAQRYYKQYRKMRAAQSHAKAQIAQIHADLEVLEAQLDDLRKCDAVAELDEIRAELVKGGYLRASHARGKPKKPAPTGPMVFSTSDGITVRVGRNSAQNERLTQAAPPNALWLHAKNMTGSHVLVDCDGEHVPEATLRDAALLAAWFSRGYRSAQVPVDYTLRKHVKKPAGTAAGFVTYTNQRTVYITPDERAVKRLTGEAASMPHD